MGRTGLSNISDLGSHKVWDRIGLKGAYTGMNSFTLTFLDTGSRDTTTGSQDGRVSGLWDADLTGSKALGRRRQRRALHRWRTDGERVMLTSTFVSRKCQIGFDASVHLRCGAILAASIVLVSASDTDLEAASNDIGNIFGREGGEVGGRGVMMRHVSEGVRAARRHAGASN